MEVTQTNGGRFRINPRPLCKFRLLASAVVFIRQPNQTCHCRHLVMLVVVGGSVNPMNGTFIPS